MKEEEGTKTESEENVNGWQYLTMKEKSEMGKRRRKAQAPSQYGVRVVNA